MKNDYLNTFGICYFNEEINAIIVVFRGTELTSLNNFITDFKYFFEQIDGF